MEAQEGINDLKDGDLVIQWGFWVAGLSLCHMPCGSTFPLPLYQWIHAEDVSNSSSMNMDADDDLEEITGEFDCSATEQGMILGSFFWGYVLTQMPGGILSHQFGGKWPLGIGLFFAGLATILTPLAARTHMYALCFARVVCGLGEGFAFPAMHGLLASPAEHPRISMEELNFIEKTIGNQASKVKVPTPWAAIFTSMPFYAILIGHIGHAWGLYTLLHQLPTYLRNMLHFDIRENSWLSALPYIVMWVLSIFITQIADMLIARGTLRTVVVRKGCQSIAHLGSAILLIAASYSGCDRIATVTLLTLSVGINGAIYGGYVVNHVDIARNHAATLSGITHTIANITGFCVPYVASIFLREGNTFENWQFVFFIAAAVYIIDVNFYVIFASGTEQPWNRGYSSPPSSSPAK